MANTPVVTISDINKALNIDSPNDDFIILNNLLKLPNFEHPFRLDGLIFSVCTKGEIELKINSKKVLIRKNQLIVYLPKQMIECVRYSREFYAKTIILSGALVEEIRSTPIHHPLPLLLYMTEYPCVMMDADQVEIFLEYYNYIEKRMNREKKYFQNEIIRYILKAVFYEGNHVIQSQMEVGNSNRTKKEHLFEVFFKLVSIYCKKDRSVSFYAKKLKLTPKYLSTAIKEVSGKSAGEWIDEQVIREAKSLLKTDIMSVQQIAEELSFANQSFFGKYFKQHTGFSPREYRKKMGVD